MIRARLTGAPETSSLEPVELASSRETDRRGSREESNYLPAIPPWGAAGGGALSRQAGKEMHVAGPVTNPDRCC